MSSSPASHLSPLTDNLQIVNDKSGVVGYLHAIIELLNRDILSLSELLNDHALKWLKNTDDHSPLIKVTLSKHLLPLLPSLNHWHQILCHDDSKSATYPLVLSDLLQLLFYSSTSSNPSASIWSLKEVIKTGLLINVEGSRHSVSKITSYVLSCPIHVRHHIRYHLEHHNQTSSLWIKLDAESRLFYAQLMRVIHRESDHAHTIFRPLSTALDIWTPLQALIHPHPLLKTLDRSASYDIMNKLILIECSLDGVISTKHLSKHTFYNIEDHLERQSRQLQQQISPTVWPPSETSTIPFPLQLTWLRTQSKAVSTGLFIPHTRTANRLARSLLFKYGLHLLSNIEVIKHHNLTEGEIWRFTQVTTAQLVSQHLRYHKGFDPVEGEEYLSIVEMYLVSTRHKNQVWLPQGLTLKPFPEIDALYRWCTTVYDHDERSWASHLQLHNDFSFCLLQQLSPEIDLPSSKINIIRVVALSMDTAQSLEHHCHLQYQTEWFNDLPTLNFLKEIPVQLDLEDHVGEAIEYKKGILSQLDTPLTNNQPNAPLTDSQPNAPLTDSQPDAPLTDSQPDAPLTDNHIEGAFIKPVISRNQFKRIEQKKLTLSPKELATQWFSKLSDNIPRIIAGVSTPDEWRTLANQIWWLNLHERAIDALIWSILELISEAPKANINQHLSGWSDRLKTISMQARVEYRLAGELLLSLIDPQKALSPQGKKSLLQYLNQAQEASERYMHIVTLFSYFHLEDRLAKSRTKEWVARSLALGLPAHHCDPLIQGVLKQSPQYPSTLVSQHSISDDKKQSLSLSPLHKILNWGQKLIAELHTSLDSVTTPATESALLIQEQLSISWAGLNTLLHHGEWVEYPKTKIIPAEIARLLMSQYTHMQGVQSPQGLSRLRASSLCTFWCQHSTLNLRLVNVTPLGVSKSLLASASVSAPMSPLEIAHVTIATLTLTLPQAIRSLRPRVRSYYSFRDVLKASINEALKRYDRPWLIELLPALDQWIKELMDTPTAPKEVASQLDLERLKVYLALHPQSVTEDIVNRWIKRWLLSSNKLITWRHRLRLALEFGTQGLETLSSYCSGKDLQRLIAEIQEVVELAALKAIADPLIKETEINLDRACLQLLLSSRLEQMVTSVQNDPISKENLFKNATDTFCLSLIQWVCSFENSMEQQGQVCSFKPPLRSWLYQLQYLNTEQLNDLASAISQHLHDVSLNTKARCWFIIEDAFLATPLFNEEEQHYLKPWLRSRERILRRVWSLI